MWTITRVNADARCGTRQGLSITIFTFRNSSCGKVMFSQLSVILSGGACVVGGVHGGACVAMGHTWQGACMAGGVHGRGGHVWRGGMHGGRACVVGGCACMAGEMATAADSTHPIGMHSRF